MNDYFVDGTSEFVRFISKSGYSTVGNHESRIMELEELLDIERDVRRRLEKENNVLQERVDVVNGHENESSVSSSQYNDAIKRRDGDIGRLRKELERISLTMESSEQELRKRNHMTMMELQNEIESLQKHKIRCEKERVIMLTEIEASLVQCDLTMKHKVSLEAKFENAESQLQRSKSTVEDLERQIKEMSCTKTGLVEENGTLKTTIEEIDHLNNALKKSKYNLEFQLEEMKKLVDEEMRQKESFQVLCHKTQNDNEQLKLQLEDEIDCRCRVQQQLGRVNGEVNTLRSRYESEILECTMEMDELRKKTTATINDLRETASKEHAKLSSLEKSRQQMSMEVTELTAELARMESESDHLHHRLKTLETENKDFDKQLQEVMNEAMTLRMTNSKLSSENCRLRVNIEEEQLKNNCLKKHSLLLSDELKENKERLDSLSKDLSEVQCVRVQLESERDDLTSVLNEKRDLLADTERKYLSSQSELHQLRSDLEQRLLEKSEELETTKKSSQRVIEELSANLSELETKYRTEMCKLKKKYEYQRNQLEEQINTIKKENVELLEDIQKTSASLKEVENELEEEKHDLLLAQEKLSSSERRRSQLQGDLEDSNRLLEAADKSRRNIQIEIETISSRSADFIAQINSLANDKRKLESEIATLKADLDDMTISKMDNEERASKLSNEANVLMDELRQEQEVSRKNESTRKNLALELKDIKIRLEKRESSAMKDITKNNQMHQERIKELEIEVECERTKNKECQMQCKKQERLMKDLQHELDDERNSILELKHLLEGAQMRIGGYKRQVEELESTNTETMGRYRRAQKYVDETDLKVLSVESKTYGKSKMGIFKVTSAW